MNKIHSIKDPGSAITHFIGVIGALAATLPLLIKAYRSGGGFYTFACGVFIASMFLLYSASTAYHTFDISEKVNRILRKLDHMMIFVFVAGSYTPVCLIVLKDNGGYAMLAAVWAIAIAGCIIKLFWITCPKWFSSVLYIAMGWVVVVALTPLYEHMPRGGFAWLAAGGILYTIGGVIYALKLGKLNRRFPHFGSHEIFHVFVLAGSVCHFIVMYRYVLAIPM